MGVMEADAREKDTGPECPVCFDGLHEVYRELKFIRREDGDMTKITPRDMLTWQDLRAYTEVTGRHISYFDAEVIMGLDAIFEGRNDV